MSGINSIEELDAKLDDEFSSEESVEETTEEQVETPSEETSTTEIDNDEGTENSEEEQEPSPTDIEQPRQKHTKEEQRAYAFNKLAGEKANAVKELKKYEALLDRLANASGAATRDAYIESLDKKLVDFESKKQGVTPEVYRQLQQQKEQLDYLKNQETQRIQQQKANNFKSALDDVVKEYDFKEEDVSSMFSILEKDGYTLDTLLSLPNPKLVIKGALMDKINEKNVQRQRDKQAKEQINVDGEQFITTNNAVYDEDEEIRKEVLSWARENGYNV